MVPRCSRPETVERLSRRQWKGERIGETSLVVRTVRSLGAGKRVESRKRKIPRDTDLVIERKGTLGV